MTELTKMWTEPTELVDSDPFSARLFNRTINQNQLYLLERPIAYIDGSLGGTDFEVTATSLVEPAQDAYRLQLQTLTGNVLLIGNFTFEAPTNASTYVGVKVDDTYYVGARELYEPREYYLGQYYCWGAGKEHSFSFAIPVFLEAGLHTFEPAFMVSSGTATIHLSDPATRFYVREF